MYGVKRLWMSGLEWTFLFFCTVCCRLRLTTSNKRTWWWWWRWPQGEARFIRCLLPNNYVHGIPRTLTIEPFNTSNIYLYLKIHIRYLLYSTIYKKNKTTIDKSYHCGSYTPQICINIECAQKRCDGCIIDSLYGLRVSKSHNHVHTIALHVPATNYQLVSRH